MASQLSTESWMYIFSYLETRADLHSSLLVNRFWCKIIVHLLWERPFSYPLSNEKVKSVIKTYLKCLSRESIVRLEEMGVKFMIFNERPMFRYSEFLKDLVIDSSRFDLCIYHLVYELKNKGKQKVIVKGRESQDSDQDLKVDYDVRKIQQNYSKELDLVFEELIKLICHHSDRIRSLSVSPCKMVDYMVKHLRENNNHFQRIKSFTFNSISTSSRVYKSSNIHESFKVYELIVALSCVSKDISHIRINGYQKKLGDSLENLLKSQNNLRSLDLEYLAEPAYYEPILLTSRIISSLNSLSFKNIDFGSITQRSMDSLTELSQNLKVFKVALCLNCSLLCDTIKQCSNLVEFTYETYRFGEDLNFLLTILKSSSASLKYLDIFWIRDDDNDSISLLKRQELIDYISKYSTQLVYLKLRRLNSEDLFSIWNGCKQLEMLSFFCSEQSDWDDCLEDLGRLLPCTLKVLTIGHWIEIPFSPMALERFLRGCKERLRKLEIYSLKRLCEHSEYVSVLRNSGVCYDLLSH